MAKYSRRDFMKRSAVVGAAAFVPPPPKVVAMIPKTEVINVTIVDGKINYDVCRPEVNPGDGVLLNCIGHPFAIHFPGITPVGSMSYRSMAWDSFPKAELKQHPSLAKKMPLALGTNSIFFAIPSENPLAGCFKYFVAVQDGEAILTDDPDIIINPRPKG